MEILEVGSFVGFSARWILEVCSGWQGKLTSVDPNIRHRRIDTPGRILKDFNQRFAPDRLETIEGFFGAPRTFYEDYETHEPRQSRAFVDQLLASRVRIDRHWERRFDFIFIDGDHSFDAVKENFQIALGLLRDGGCIAFHDALSWEGVNTALDEIRRENADSAEVRIFGKLDHWVFQGLLRKHTDGIGFFRKLGPSKLVA
jgi:predicted O-methyltransferase YrrM